ncbi:MAG: hypothetical protein IT201_14330 [Thermoleophilia bacterium]|nr:hypothetical protein [Thermoleophilia bacterium]
MTVRRDFELAFDESYFVRLHGEGFSRLAAQPARRARLASVLAEASEVMEPAACYDAIPIEKVLHGQLRLAGGTRIGGGPVVEVVGGAEVLYVAICTVGRALDERVRRHREAGRRFEMLILDELGSWGVDQVRQQLYEGLGCELAERGWRTSSPLSPGEGVWSIREQRTIFGLLEPDEIGVRLLPSYVIDPVKSLTVVFGAGASPMGVEGMTNCDFCSIQDRCRYAGARVAH